MRKGAPSAARPMKSAKRSAGSDTALRTPAGNSKAIPAPPIPSGKFLRDVFEAGDAWFRTGDLMRRDEHGFYYFVDRVGDTFRWKGENVATSEVAAALMEFPGIGEATVYGVAVPGTEGAAGMAALVADRPLDFAKLRQHLAKRLPGYARPLFLRLTANIAATSTFKHNKNELVARRLRRCRGAAMRSISTIRNGMPMCRSMPRFISGSTPEKFGSKPEF